MSIANSFHISRLLWRVEANHFDDFQSSVCIGFQKVLCRKFQAFLSIFVWQSFAYWLTAVYRVQFAVCGASLCSFPL